MQVLVPLLTCLQLVIATGSFAATKAKPLDYDAGRNRLIAYMLSHQLPAQHFDHKTLDDDLSNAAFDLYLKSLDPRKRFFLEKDVNELKVFATKVDDELRRGLIVLPDAAAAILNDRINDVQQITDQIPDQELDPHRIDYLELDPEKIEYAVTVGDLKELWRKIIKMQVISEYLDLYEDGLNKDKERKKTELTEQDPDNLVFDESLWKKSIEKIKEKNHRYFKRLKETSRQEQYNNYFDAVARAFDPHTNYMAPTSKEDFDIHMRGSLEGIGALLREDDGYIKVVNIIPGSAAEREGHLEAEDIILSVSEKDGDPVDLIDMRIREAVSYIRGPKGTEVRLMVQKPDGHKQLISIIRDVVQIEETYVKSEVLENGKGEKIGYITIPSFYRDFEDSRNGGKSRNVTDDMEKELLELQPAGITGLIIDVRNNGGGSLSDAVEISGLFLPGGPVLQIKNSEGNIRVLEDDDPKVIYDGPVIVLVNKFSASASEILAAALQDYGRALIVGGDHTHGKGTVQALLDLNRNLPLLHLKKYDDLGALKVTIQKFYRIDGQSTQYKGIEPDVVVPSVLDYLETGEKYLDNSLPWDQVKPVEHVKWEGKRFELQTVSKKSREFVKHSDPFQRIVEETEKAGERSKKTLSPVSLGQMYAERIELAKARKNGEEFGLSGEHLSEESGSNTAKKKKELKEQLSEDPYVQLSLALFGD